jgi:SAM-dependent methyltransferase
MAVEMSLGRLVMRQFYCRAQGRPERLPWHRDRPGQVLGSAVKVRAPRDKALDLGCGAGVLFIWLAERGMDVTGIDIYPEAIAMAASDGGDEGPERRIRVPGPLLLTRPATDPSISSTIRAVFTRS